MTWCSSQRSAVCWPIFFATFEPHGRCLSASTESPDAIRVRPAPTFSPAPKRGCRASQADKLEAEPPSKLKMPAVSTAKVAPWASRGSDVCSAFARRSRECEASLADLRLGRPLNCHPQGTLRAGVPAGQYPGNPRITRSRGIACSLSVSSCAALPIQQQWASRR